MGRRIGKVKLTLLARRHGKRSEAVDPDHTQSGRYDEVVELKAVKT